MKVLKFFSPHCGPCKVMENNLKEANIEYESINIEEDNGDMLADKYNVKGLPTIIIIDEHGAIIKQHTGILTVENLKHFI